MTSGLGVPIACKVDGVDPYVAENLSERADLQRRVAVDRHSGPSIRMVQHIMAASDTNDSEALPL